MKETVMLFSTGGGSDYERYLINASKCVKRPDFRMNVMDSLTINLFVIKLYTLHP